MQNKSLYDVIKSPLTTEKTNNLLQNNMYTFLVDKRANKAIIKKAIEFLFNVKVLCVNTVNIKGKKKVFRGKEGRRPSFKKGIVKLESGQFINMQSGVS